MTLLCEYCILQLILFEHCSFKSEGSVLQEMKYITCHIFSCILVISQILQVLNFIKENVRVYLQKKYITMKQSL
jgi:hypothetical protein